MSTLIKEGQFFLHCEPFIYPPCSTDDSLSAAEIRFRCALSGRIPKLLMKFSTALLRLHFRTSFTHFLPTVNIFCGKVNFRFIFTAQNYNHFFPPHTHSLHMNDDSWPEFAHFQSQSSSFVTRGDPSPPSFLPRAPRLMVIGIHDSVLGAKFINPFVISGTQRTSKKKPFFHIIQNTGTLECC